MDILHVFIFALLIVLIVFILYLLSTVISGVSTDLFLMNPENYKKNPEMKDPIVVILSIIAFLLLSCIKF